MSATHVEFLLVEDNPGDVRLTREALKESKLNLHLSVACDGVEAMAFLRREGDYANAPRPDLILLDLNLPRKDGREVLAEVKSDPELRRIPVVVLTTSQAEQDIVQTYDLHANCFITKALDLEQFIETVHSIEEFWLAIARLPSQAPVAPHHIGSGSTRPHAHLAASPNPTAATGPIDATGAAAPAAPIAPVAQAGDNPAMPASNNASETPEAEAPMRILLVEDNRGDARLVREMLVDAGMPFDLTHVERLSEALPLAGAGGIDVIMLDLSLPDGHGLAMVTTLHEATPDTAIVVMSGNDDEQVAVRGVREGAQDYLVKGRVDGAGLVRALRYAVERQRTEDRLRHDAHHDALTGLPNRVLVHDRLRQQLAQARRHDRPLAVLFLDLDRFKWINDTLGHETGDQLLQEVADRISCCTRGGDTVARLGGDEFVLLLPDLTHPSDAATVAKKITSVLADPFHLSGEAITIGASIGISVYPIDGIDSDSLLKQADTALYRVKEQGKNGYAFYTEGVETMCPQPISPTISDDTASRATRGTILVVDDDPFIVEMLEAVLEEQGYAVLAALGTEVLDTARETHLDLIMMDLMMPVMDGVQLSRLLRADPRTTDIPIIAMSAQARLRATSELMPVDARLAKPFDLDLLYATIAQWMPAS